MKIITAPNIQSLQKKVNDYIFTNSAYIPDHVTRLAKAKPKAKTKAKEQDDQTEEETKSSSEFHCLLTITEDTRIKTATFFCGSLEKLAASAIADANLRSITHKKIIPDTEGNVIAFIVQ